MKSWECDPLPTRRPLTSLLGKWVFLNQKELMKRLQVEKSYVSLIFESWNLKGPFLSSEVVYLGSSLGIRDVGSPTRYFTVSSTLCPRCPQDAVSKGQHGKNFLRIR